MMKLSTGADATLGEYKKLVDSFFGPDGKAAKYINDKIAEQGEDMEVIVDEGQMIHALAAIEYG